MADNIHKANKTIPSEPSYHIYGLTLKSSFPFRYHLKPSYNVPDLRFIYHGVSDRTDPPGVEVTGNGLGEDSGFTVMRLFIADDLETIVFPGIAAFECSGTEIHAYAFIEGIEYLVEICLIGNVLAYWLERRGISAIHASAVVVDNCAVAFIAGTSRGKTTTACGFLAAGHQLLTDDILPVVTASWDITAQSGFPQMKLLPEQFAFLGGDPHGLKKVHPLFEKLMVPIGDGIGNYHDGSVSLGAIYLLDRSEEVGDPEVSPVSQSEALMELVRHSFAAELMDAVDRGSHRLERLAAIARTVPVRRLCIPAGYDCLETVRLAVIEEMKRGVV